MPSLAHHLPEPSRAALRLRYWRAMLFAARAALAIAWWDILLRRIGLRALARRTAPDRYTRIARRYRDLAVSLGGLWIKVGQFLSARVDVLPVFITDELAGLQDEVPTEPPEHMLAVVEAEFGRPVGEIFAWFDREALASASLGQVHRARLFDGRAVVVKVQRPGIVAIIRVDLTALRGILGWLKRYRAITRRADLDSLFAEFSRTLWAELDYPVEAENARTFGRMFAEDPHVRVPAVYAEQTTGKVLTLEDVYFIKITDYAGIEAAGVDRAEVARRLFNTYLRQIFIEGFFHADPHPGNLFVQPPDGETGWRLVFVDFGMVGRLTPQAKQGLRDMAIGVGAQDLDRLMRAYQELGVLLPSADVDRLREATRALFDRLWGRSMRDLIDTHPREMREFAIQFRDLLYEMPFQVPSDLIFLGRCLAILSGMCTGLNPAFNVFEGLAPFARAMLQEEGGDWLDRILDWLTTNGRVIISLPGRLDAVLNDVKAGRLTVTTRPDPALERRLDRLTGAVNRLVAAVVFAALLLAATLLHADGELALSVAALALALVAILVVLLR
ncbi:MAG TPA: AarF/UbiB family protein [Anaerolineales bacterium]|nr:AarF/UbiB family protein [Anaerolineales bacterium]